MATKVAQKRLQKEYLNMQKSPPPFIWACPEEKNILDWHFIIRGPPDTPYAGGEYHGLIWFPSDYPFKPPDVKMFTPSGRFEVGHKICMSMTSYHPSRWNAAWSVATILTGLLSFMLSDEITAGAARTTDEQKRALAKTSHAFNLNNKKFREMFPKYATPEMTDLPDMGQQPHDAGLTLPSQPDSVVSSAPSSVPSPSASPAPPSRAEPSLAAPAPVDAVNARPVGGKEDVGKTGWKLPWRWITAILVLAVLGRLSNLVGLR
ncbi:ubiquitin-conjugating enzyme/RWD-like protein [Papiliotrema laurentii]|uniref:Ubiquitin-conjugating enzyme E2 6 n=1 Tax=Papiliotrema laurentii TaxID=5418 RepID=A0AAD9FN10_PAPLA|nr:ubiquitin-conjugating enzyme/RWD-like protein [Papiliotrema laurentii]